MENNPKLFKYKYGTHDKTLDTDITLRDLFAMVAMQALVNRCETDQCAAERGYDIADKMLRHRNKNET